MISYLETTMIIKTFKLIINTTPLGQYPNTHSFPNIPYSLLSNNHYCLDLIYNPEKTVFLEKSESHGAKIINGKKMLVYQAEASWKIWKKMIKKYNV